MRQINFHAPSLLDYMFKSTEHLFTSFQVKTPKRTFHRNARGPFSSGKVNGNAKFQMCKDFTVYWAQDTGQSLSREA